ncbi:alpha/beta fold hydrolase [Nocardia sp. NPDC003482]
MSTLEVPGARLYYEMRGEGPLLVLVPGANGDAHAFTGLAERLARHYTVVTYDRRGFTRSALVGAQDYARRLATDADDVRALIESLGAALAIVLGSSSGAVVALRLLVDHPSVVRTVVAFEPAAMRFLPDGGGDWIAFFAELYRRYRREGPEPALAAFRERTFPPIDHEVMTRARTTDAPFGLANVTYWFERELREYTSVEIDPESLRPWAFRIIPALGRACAGYPNHGVTRELGRLFDRPVLELPGGHVGYVTHTAEFADTLLARLATAGDIR